ncbi:ribonuclease P protein component [Actinomycetospora chiangmaiensis]|uniref:ribonuclease P protein component n=1 Tax=Actinomycetospora chiangmaiensis TaxID=402650 RepID=UPI000365EE45|nr:ribonuclease P protein component [Actinomycetospora chiangmaiensis]
MLPPAHRVRRPDDFRLVLRRGRKAGRRRLSVHALTPDGSPGPSRAGFVVGRAVGNSVVRHRTTRRLRHLVAERLDALPTGTLLVVRAHPPAAGATSAELADDLDAALRRLDLRPRLTVVTSA